MTAVPGFKSQGQSSSAAPFLAPPTIGPSHQHSGQVWPCGVQPIISKLLWTPLQILFGAPLLAAPCYKRTQRFENPKTGMRPIANEAETHISPHGLPQRWQEARDFTVDR